jgi:ABC-type transport system involved in multi-copper enzyme maturation permease subunit
VSGFGHDLYRTYRSRLFLPSFLFVLVGFFVLFIALGSVPSRWEALALTVLILGILAGFIGSSGANRAFTRQSLSGLLDSILVQPITRGELITARFLGVVLAAATPLTIVFLLDWNGLANRSPPIDPTFLIVVYFAILAEVSFGAGLVLLLAQATDSQVTVTSASIFLTLIFAFGLLFVGFQLRSQGVIHSLLAWLGPLAPIAPLQLALISYASWTVGDGNPLVIAVGGLFWGLVPFLGALALFRSSD